MSVWMATNPTHSSLNAEDEHGKLRGQIEQLRTALEHAQMIRRRKIEYDAVTEKVNTLPSREELEQCVHVLCLVFPFYAWLMIIFPCMV